MEFDDFFLPTGEISPVSGAKEDDLVDELFNSMFSNSKVVSPPIHSVSSVIGDVHSLHASSLSLPISRLSPIHMRLDSPFSTTSTASGNEDSESPFEEKLAQALEGAILSPPNSQPFNNTQFSSSVPHYNSNNTSSSKSSIAMNIPKKFSANPFGENNNSNNPSCPEEGQSSRSWTADRYRVMAMSLDRHHTVNSLKKRPPTPSSPSVGAVLMGINCSSDEDSAMLQKREKNRLAAERCRRKKQHLIETLTKKCQDLEEEKEVLRARNRLLEQQLALYLSRHT